MSSVYNKSDSPKNVVRAAHLVTRDDRALASGDGSKFLGCTIWFTGLSGSGKSTLAFSLEQRLVSMGIQAYTLDGDNLRLGLNKDLRFSDEDRAENIRRVAEVAKLFADSGTCAITSFISPFEKASYQRQLARKLHEEAGLPFVEVYLSTPLEVCEARDAKSLYAKARRGEIKDFTGINSPYEKPLNAELCLNTADIGPEECTNRLIQILVDKEIIPMHVTHRTLHELYVTESERSLYLERAMKYPKVSISKTDLQWVQVLAEGWATPLRGFMREAQYLQVLHFGGLIDGGQKFTNLSIPIVLAITSETKEKLGPFVQHITLTHRSEPVAVLLDIEFYEHRKEERCNRIFGICDRGHPVVDQIMSSGDWLVGGDLHVLNPIVWNDGLDQYRLSPRQLRDKFAKIGVRP
ncbi:unnamed protein product [Hydatigera taeniaeformis]|uniref:adenylyl-sulfate kinase n=1 Tax=Hydatigena taeniaeformis TaxID=6205 RepID=A0A0R3WMT9_HYDTA|nr:unnamed protein product [Hydatigera taeniaeformis]